MQHRAVEIYIEVAFHSSDLSVKLRYGEKFGRLMEADMLYVLELIIL